MLKCYKGFSLDDEFYNAGSSGGVASTLGFIALKFKLCNGVITLNRTVSPPKWFVAVSKEDLLKSCGSTYEDLKFDSYLCKSGFPVLGQIGKPCDMKPIFSPNISIFCSHTYRRKSFVISKAYAQTRRSKWKTIFSDPVKCFLCMDHLGLFADVNVGDDQVDPKLNNIIVRSRLGLDLIRLGVDNNLLKMERMKCIKIRRKQKYLWKWR